MRDHNRESMRAWALAGELGYGIAGPLVFCTGLGWWLDGQLGTGHWLVMAGLLLGLISTVGTFYRLATAYPARTPPKRPAPAAGGGAAPDEPEGGPSPP